MIIVVAGPSGSGKTTFIKLALNYINNARIISTDVYSPNSRLYEKNLGRRRVSLKTFNENQKRGLYSAVNIYQDSKYGYSISKDYNESSYACFLDYPGEYPECIELTDFIWHGVLILPSSIDVLRERLITVNREYRIESSIVEYRECLSDINEGRIKQKWITIFNESYDNLIEGIKKLNDIIMQYMD